MINNLTVVMPVKNELEGLKKTLPDLMHCQFNVIVVDDGSSDGSGDYAQSVGATVIRHRWSKGNGAAVKAGMRAATTLYIGLMDGDGQHSVKDMISLYEKIEQQDLDLVVGSRDRKGQAGFGRWLANSFYNKFASLMVGGKVDDLTSGQRVFRADKLRPVISMLPNTFSYPTTSSMIFYRLGHDVDYEPISVMSRIGKSHIKILRDGFRFFLIIMKIGILFSPFKLFSPIAIVLFLLGLARYAYTYSISGTFTNMSALLFVSSVLVFLMGVLSEQVSILHYAALEKDK